MEEVRSNGSVAARYKYLADGTKLEVSDPLGGGYLYLGSLIYNKRGNIYEPESTGFAGGRVVFASSGSDVQYHVTDYLGSVRVVADRDGKLLEKIDYYPFGKRIETAQQQVTGNRYLFNGKEWQSTGDLNVLDYGARHYDPTLGRWFNPDPVMQFLNPYTFCGNDPINGIDTDGNLVIFINGWNNGNSTRDYPSRFNEFSPLLSWKGVRDYWATSNNFDYNVMKHLGDYSAFIEMEVLERWFIIIAKAVIEYLESIGLNRSLIQFIADFAPHKSSKLQAAYGILIISFHMTPIFG